MQSMHGVLGWVERTKSMPSGRLTPSFACRPPLQPRRAPGPRRGRAGSACRAGRTCMQARMHAHRTPRLVSRPAPAQEPHYPFQAPTSRVVGGCPRSTASLAQLQQRPHRQPLAVPFGPRGLLPPLPAPPAHLQPRVQPRRISTVMRSCTVSTNGTRPSCWKGSGWATRRLTRAGTPSTTGTTAPPKPCQQQQQQQEQQQQQVVCLDL